VIKKIVLIVAVATAGCATNQPQRVQPTIHFSGPLSIQEPQGGTWNLIRKNVQSTAFQRDESPGITGTIAYTASYAANGPVDSVKLLAEVKRNVGLYLTSPNAKVLSTEFVQDTNRPYPCVRVLAKAQVTTPQWPQADLFRQFRLLVCQPSGNTQFGFVVGFSYSSDQPKVEYDDQASKFFNGVQLASN